MSRVYVLITLGVFAVSSVPYVAGFLFESADRAFTGIVFDVVDTAQYYAWMRAFSHDTLIANPLTPEPGAERFFNLQWWLLGQLAFKTPLGPTWTYQILRVLALGGFAASLAWFCRIAIPKRAPLAFAVVMLSSGFGWALVVLKQWTGELRYPLDVHVGEANTYFSAMAFPHLLAAGALLLTIFSLILTTTWEIRWRNLAITSGLTLALGFSHGYDLIPVTVIPGAVVAVMALRERKIPPQAWPVAGVFVAAGPPALYALALTHLDATWEGVLSQYGNAGVYSPTPPHLVILLGLPLLMALPQMRPQAWKNPGLPAIFVRAWFLIGFFLLYIPTDYQIKMLIAYQVPVGILAVRTFEELTARYGFSVRAMPRHRAFAAASVALIAFVALTNVYLTSWRIVDLRREEYPYYLSRDDYRVLDELSEQAGEGDVVMSSPEVGVFVPVYSDARPYVAHWAQTLHFFDRRSESRRFFEDGTSDSERAQIVAQESIGFVISGPAEASLNGESQPPKLAFEEISSGTTTLYRTGHDALAR